MKDIQEILENVYKKTKRYKKGKVASYIPELKKTDPNIFSISICLIDGTIYNIGDTSKKVSIQSISKVLALFLAIRDNGILSIQKKIGSYGSFLPFDSITAIEISKNHTLNPFVNAGAISTTSTIKNKNKKDFWNKVYKNANNFAGVKLQCNKKVYDSEMKTNQRNISLAYLLESKKKMYNTVDDTIDIYTKHCSLMVNSDNLATMACVIANEGIHPITKKKIMTKKECNYITGQVLGNGMYEYSDTWLIETGVPAKSGVGGGILAIIPGLMGIGIISPRLDTNRNSVRGIEVIKELSKILNLSLITKPVCDNVI